VSRVAVAISIIGPCDGASHDGAGPTRDPSNGHQPCWAWQLPRQSPHILSGNMVRFSSKAFGARQLVSESCGDESTARLLEVRLHKRVVNFMKGAGQLTVGCDKPS